MAEARTRFSRTGWRRVLVAGIALCAGIAALNGCASKVTTVDESLQPPGFPEGKVSPTSQLIVYRTTSTPLSYYTEGRGTDRGPRAPKKAS